MSRRIRALNALMVVASCVVGLMLVEIGLRIVSPVEMRLLGDDIRLPYFKRYEIVLKDTRILEERISHQRNRLGFRGPAPPNNFKDLLTIVAVGGSTTESYLVSDGKDWPAVLGSLLSGSLDRVWVNNAGISGHTTYGHIWPTSVSLV